ncbi:MAG TPA: hypothetical protein VH054_26690 [Polyangiaceae bacterium]|nr:hypothetical protein [Polyangiaceae bacterium]
MASGARADTEACARVLEEARDLRAAGKLKDALTRMNACTECAALADVCASTRDSMRDALPTLSVRARACDGTPLDALVTIDGQLATSAMSLDPGRHDVRARIGARAEEQTVFVAESEHRSVSLVIADAPRPTPPGVWVLGASSVGALVVAGALFGISASLPDRMTLVSPATSGDVNATPFVTPDETKHDFAVAAGVALAVSITVVVTALVVYLTRPFPHTKGPD